MLEDRTHKISIGAWLALALFFSAGLVQAVVTDDINDSVDEGGANSTESNFTEATAIIDNDTGAIETMANASNESAAETAPKEAGEGVEESIHAVCLNGCNYTTIQAAVEAAKDGEVVEVRSGIYNESVVVDKRITLRGVNTGEGIPVVNAQGYGSAIVLNASGIVVEGLYITDAGPWPSAGIVVVSNDSIISDCSVMKGEWVGIYLKGSNNTVSNCTSSNNGNDGVLIYRAFGNLVSDSLVSNNADDGISILSFDSNRIEGNLIVNNTDVGLFVDNSTNTVVTGNVISYNRRGISLLNSGIDKVGPNLFLNNTLNMESA